MSNNYEHEQIKRNFIYSMEEMSRVSPHIVMERTPQMIRYESNLAHPLFNRVITYHGALSEDGIDEIGRIANDYIARKTPFTWLTWSHDANVEVLGHVLQAKGLNKVDEMSGMSLELRNWNYEKKVIPGFVIKPILSSSEMGWFRDIVPSVFEVNGEIGEVFGQISEDVALGENAAYRHYIGILDGQPVAALTAVHVGETIGIYNVATLEAYRRRGLGCALIFHALHEGQAEGRRLAVLLASTMGEGLYKSIGFNVDVTIEVYLG
ncbi:GNAT family N-acetyltransferase [Paenibacillus qinlingensis]|uniref:GNAT superfamily N-acetyltransferase n=1 Tax=Paenibacillus qinlingensis TaxID=1837343 RepID=A0ABU1NUK7_9BACL|nr:GNAT family N-acetyltransferase [Paenibacillus qinlingensis]MDR6551014.1 GNAT superfamily N-acetyltransferase [Paenibacillus qinlingensis]